MRVGLFQKFGEHHHLPSVRTPLAPTLIIRFYQSSVRKCSHLIVGHTLSRWARGFRQAKLTFGVALIVSRVARLERDLGHSEVIRDNLKILA